MSTNKQSYKMVVVVDSTIKMPKGKLARQVAGAVTHSLMYHFSLFKWGSLARWYTKGLKTVVLKTDDIDDLIEQLRLFGAKTLVMTDAGKTVFNKPTRTCIALPICKENDTPPPVRNLKLL